MIQSTRTDLLTDLSIYSVYPILTVILTFQGKMVFDFGMLLTMAIVLRVLAYLILLYKTHRK